MGKFTKIAATAALLLTTTGLVATGAEAQSGRAAASKTARLGGKPNLNGIWQSMSGANWNVEAHDAAPAPNTADKVGAIGAIPAGVGVVEGGSIQYKPEAVARRDENRKSAPTRDPEAACYLPGIPRATYMDHAFQIIQGEKGDMLFAYEYHSTNRIIYMKPVEVPPIETWMGTSYGAWEGDTLKVVTLSQNPGDVKAPGGEMFAGYTWLDRSGNFLGHNATVTERFKLIDADHMMYEVTIDDPETYARPVKMSMPLYRHIEPDAQLIEFNCVPFSEMLLYGDLLTNTNAQK
jgi:hypothetical protein